MPFHITRFNHFTIIAPSGEQEKARWFYGKLLGLQEIPTPKDLQGHYHLLWFKMNDVLLHIEFTDRFTRPDAHLKGVETPFHFSVEIKDIAKTRKELEKKGAQTKDAVTIEDRDRFYLIDPFGNYIEVIEFHKNQRKAG